MGLKVIWSAKQPRSYKRVLLRYGEKRMWRFWCNWKFNKHGPHFNVITPFLRLTKCNGQVEVGLGNHYIEIGY